LREWAKGILAQDEKSAIKEVILNDMENVLETCTIQQLAKQLCSGVF